MNKRLCVIDALRGLTLLSMIIYHAVWNLVFLFDYNWTWYYSNATYLWQQSICCTFILLSGFCFSLGKHPCKRGCIVFGAGILISAVTILLMPESRIIFGILTLIGSCMLLLIPFEPLLKKCYPSLGFILNIVFFLFTKSIPDGFISIGNIQLLRLPSGWYSNMLTAYLGFPTDVFFSTDYFPLLPWFFLFIAGYYLYRLVSQNNLIKYLKTSKSKPLELFGRHSLVIYLIHQPILYGIMFILL